MRIHVVLATLLALPFAAPPAGAEACEAEDGPLLAYAAVGVYGATYYVLDTGHVYEESNGVELLQRGGANALGETDCVGSLDADYTPDTHVL